MQVHSFIPDESKSHAQQNERNQVHPRCAFQRANKSNKLPSEVVLSTSQHSPLHPVPSHSEWSARVAGVKRSQYDHHYHQRLPWFLVWGERDFFTRRALLTYFNFYAKHRSTSRIRHDPRSAKPAALGKSSAFFCFWYQYVLSYSSLLFKLAHSFYDDFLPFEISYNLTVKMFG